MALDGAFLQTIKTEIEHHIDARVDKIHQPSREEIVIILRWAGGKGKLLISASANNARIHFTNFPPENPKSPPMFCMLLRKRLGSGTLINVRQLELDRVLYLDFETTNELGDLVVITIAVEIMGRHSNIIVINQDNKILDAIKRVDNTMSGVRMVLPNMMYTIPPMQDKLNILTETDDAIIHTIESQTNAALPKAIMQTMQGFSPILAREIAHYVSDGTELYKGDLNDEQRDRLRFSIGRIREMLLTHKSVFTTVLEDNKPKDFSFINITQYGGYMQSKLFDTPSGLLDHFYAERDRIARMKQRSHNLLKLLVNTAERIGRKLDVQQSELEQSGKRDEHRIYGDIINSNLHQLKKGQSSVMLHNFYDEQNPEIQIPLDPLFTPAQNAQKYYNEYKKAATAEKMLTKLIEQAKQELIYIDSVFDAVSRTSSESELLEIREELAEQGYIKSNRKQNRMLKAQPPIEYRSTDGFTILCGRNNKQNDKLTLKQAKNFDMWFHTQKIPGSHVIIESNGQEIPNSTLEQACIIAAYNSKARESSQVPVDYTYIKNVKKPNGAKPGMVIFVDHQTAYVSPDEELVAKLRVL